MAQNLKDLLDGVIDDLPYIFSESGDHCFLDIKKFKKFYKKNLNFRNDNTVDKFIKHLERNDLIEDILN